jgi:hypothetical protein
MDNFEGLSRQVVFFQLFNSKLADSSMLQTVFYIDEQGCLKSSETGIKYELNIAHLEVLSQDWWGVSFSKSLRNDYLMQTCLQRKNNNYIRVVVNYEALDLSGKYSDEREHLSVFIQNKKRCKSDGHKCLLSDCIRKKIDSGNVTSISFVDKYSLKRYISAQMDENKIIINGDKPYNNEGLIYEGEIQLDKEVLDDIEKSKQCWMRCGEDVSRYCMRINLEKNVDIDLLVTQSIKIFDIYPKQADQIRENKEMSLTKKFFIGGLAFCAIVFMWYMYKNPELYQQCYV